MAIVVGQQSEDVKFSKKTYNYNFVYCGVKNTLKNSSLNTFIHFILKKIKHFLKKKKNHGVSFN